MHCYAQVPDEAARGVAQRQAWSEPDPMIGSFESIIIDCPDPRAFARFYAELLGAEIIGDDHDRAELVPLGNPRQLLPFQRVDDCNAAR